MDKEATSVLFQFSFNVLMMLVYVFSLNIFFLLFNNKTVYFYHRPGLCMCRYISECVQIRGHVHTMTCLLNITVLEDFILSIFF